MVCGAVNVFAHHRHWLPQPSREAVLLADPDAIVVAAAPSQHDALASWQPWTSLRAVARRRLYTVDPVLLHRATARSLEGVEALCRHIEDARGNGPER